MTKLLLDTDLFVLPSTLETPGIAALEAAAIGVPILITEKDLLKNTLRTKFTI